MTWMRKLRYEMEEKLFLPDGNIKKKNIDFIERKKNNNNILKLFDHPDYSVRIMQVRQSGCPSFWR